MSTETADLPKKQLPKSNKFEVKIAQNHYEIRQAQALRYQIFAKEMGAKLHSTVPNHDVDVYDEHCYHLLVKEKATDQLIGYTRILTSDHATATSGFYSESEFDISPILSLPGRFMEIGRTCIHPNYRNGATISLLWSGVARFLVENDFDYLMGCASIPMAENHYNSVFSKLHSHYFTPTHLRAKPKVPLIKEDNHDNLPAIALPPLLKAYLRLGAKICGEACWDNEFKVADVFILLERHKLDKRYSKHFVQRVQQPAQSQSLYEAAA